MSKFLPSTKLRSSFIVTASVPTNSCAVAGTSIRIELQLRHPRASIDDGRVSGRLIAAVLVSIARSRERGPATAPAAVARHDAAPRIRCLNMDRSPVGRATSVAIRPDDVKALGVHGPRIACRSAGAGDIEVVGGEAVADRHAVAAVG